MEGSQGAGLHETALRDGTNSSVPRLATQRISCLLHYVPGACTRFGCEASRLLWSNVICLAGNSLSQEHRECSDRNNLVLDPVTVTAQEQEITVIREVLYFSFPWDSRDSQDQPLQIYFELLALPQWH